MYSRNKGQTDRDFSLTPPPGYDGSRFRKRSDGRDDAFPLYAEEWSGEETPQRKKIYPQRNIKKVRKENPEEQDTEDCLENCPPAPPCEATSPSPSIPNEKESKGKKIEDFLRGLKSEDILLIVLIVLLAGDQSREGAETVLLLALLLCIS